MCGGIDPCMQFNAKTASLKSMSAFANYCEIELHCLVSTGDVSQKDEGCPEEYRRRLLEKGERKMMSDE